MITRHYATLALVCVILSGCMFKSVTDSTRHFTLAAIPSSESTHAISPDAENLPIGIGFVKMPAYLLRNSVAVRKSANEIEYLENALWSERLDESFQRDLAANLAELLPSDRIYLTDWTHDQVTIAVYINVQQFDVDINGQGVLIAQWRITALGSDVPLKSGNTRLYRNGLAPRARPEVIAETLSSLAAQFSRDLAQAIRDTRRSNR